MTDIIPQKNERTSMITLNGVPTDIMLFVAGENQSSHGSVFYDPKDAEMIMSADTRDLVPVDVAHLSLTSPLPDGHKAFAWFRLSCEEDGIWMRNIEWTALGSAYLESREFRFLSPAFLTGDREKITEIVSVSLTNIPAMLNPEPLVAEKKIMKEKKMSEIPESAKPKTKPEDEDTSAIVADEEIEKKDPSEEVADDAVATEEEEIVSPEDNDGDVDPQIPAEVPAGLNPEELALFAEQMRQTAEDLWKQTEELEAALKAAKGAAIEPAVSDAEPVAMKKMSKREIVDGLVADGYLKPALKTWAMRLSVESLNKFAKAVMSSGTAHKRIVEKTETHIQERVLTSLDEGSDIGCNVCTWSDGKLHEVNISTKKGNVK